MINYISKIVKELKKENRKNLTINKKRSIIRVYLVVVVIGVERIHLLLL